MELTVLVKFEPVTNYIGNEMLTAVIVRGNTEEDCYHAAHQRCMDICGDPSIAWIKERWDKDVPVDLYENEDPAKVRTGPFVDMLEELTAASALLDDDDEDEDVKDVIPFLGDDDYIFDDGSNPFEDDDDPLF